MDAATKLNLKRNLFLFVCGLTIGVTVNLISKTNKIETNVVQIEVENSSAADLFDKVKILCLVLTTESHHETKAIHVKNTWGSRCNKLIFASNVTDSELGAVKLIEDDQYYLLWEKTKHMMAYAYEKFYDDYDWFYKADDDTYAVLDNMRLTLAAYSPDDPIFFGKKFNFTEKFGYFSGGAGYVLSKKALEKFVIEALPDKNKCRQDGEGPEDWELALCMAHIGVYAGDARDRFQRETFFPFTPEGHLFPDRGLDWYWGRLYYFNDEGLHCSSNYTTTYHYVGPDYMYFLEYAIYNVQAYGVRHAYDPIPEKKNFTAVVQKLLADVGK